MLKVLALSAIAASAAAVEPLAVMQCQSTFAGDTGNACDALTALSKCFVDVSWKREKNTGKRNLNADPHFKCWLYVMIVYCICGKSISIALSQRSAATDLFCNVRREEKRLAQFFCAVFFFLLFSLLRLCIIVPDLPEPQMRYTLTATMYLCSEILTLPPLHPAL